MKYRWAARILVLACFAFLPRGTEAQSGQRSGVDAATGSSLGQNYPNPVSEQTTIPFAIGGAPECADPARRYRVTLRVYNMLAQLVAVPVLQSGSSGGAGGESVRELVLACGQYTAFWDGKHSGSGRDAASGIYLYRLEVDGRVMVRKMTVIR
jgi:hypothetical protein